MSFVATTRNITVTVMPIYLALKSNFFEKKFSFAYFVGITNDGVGSVQLLRRRWMIVDSNEKIKIVEGDGVVGKQPFISPGETYTYNSFCVIETLSGFMEGSYTMLSSDGEEFEVMIPKFFLNANSN